MQYKKGKCVECPEDEPERYIVKKIAGHGYCYEHNEERKKERKASNPSPSPIKRKKPLKRKLYSFKRKATGERILFESIWGTRVHRSFLDGTPLGNDGYAWLFAHVLRKAKGFWPKFKLYDKNIILLTKKQHDNYDLYVNKPEILLEMDHRWQKVFDLREGLLQEYRAQYG